MTLNCLGALLLAAALAAATLPAIAAQERAGESAAAELEAETATTAPVELDGRRLFQVHGVSAYPAEQRAERIKNCIEALARNPDFLAEALHPMESEVGVKIAAGDRLA